jgi:hypothetical protein
VTDFVRGARGKALNGSVFHPTCNIAGLTSGHQGAGIKTVLPATASAKVDFRLVPNQDPDDILDKLRRYLDAQGTVCRLHQEDTCQALSVLTPTAKHKYEAFGGPSLRRIAALLDNWSADPRELLRYVTFNVIVGNADLHGKNVSLLHHLDGSIALAPLYDVMCTTYYDGNGGRRRVDTEPGLFVAGRRDITAVDTDALVDEAESWHIRRSTARAIVGGTNHLSGAVDPEGLGKEGAGRTDDLEIVFGARR